MKYKYNEMVCLRGTTYDILLKIIGINANESYRYNGFTYDLKDRINTFYSIPEYCLRGEKNEL